jgi:hypothetical protein
LSYAGVCARPKRSAAFLSPNEAVGETTFLFGRINMRCQRYPKRADHTEQRRQARVSIFAECFVQASRVTPASFDLSHAACPRDDPQGVADVTRVPAG